MYIFPLTVLPPGGCERGREFEGPPQRWEWSAYIRTLSSSPCQGRLELTTFLSGAPATWPSSLLPGAPIIALLRLRALPTFNLFKRAPENGPCLSGAPRICPPFHFKTPSACPSTFFQRRLELFSILLPWASRTCLFPFRAPAPYNSPPTTCIYILLPILKM